MMRTPGFGGDQVRAGRRRSRRRSAPGTLAPGRPDAGAAAVAGATERRVGWSACFASVHRRSTTPHEQGSAAAEFAVAIPVVVLVLGCCLGAIQVASQQVRLTDAAADAARTLARGDSLGVAAARVHRIDATAALHTSTTGDFVCVQLSAPAGFGPAALAGVRVRASGCALVGGL